jgi:hypothetical protein
LFPRKSTKKKIKAQRFRILYNVKRRNLFYLLTRQP